MGREANASVPELRLRRSKAQPRHPWPMFTHATGRPTALLRRALLGLAASGLALSLAACAGGTTSSNLPGDVSSMEIPTFPPDDLVSGTAACIDAPTMAIIDRLRAPGADVPALLEANKDALEEGLADLESADPAVTDWRDAFLSALAANDVTAAAVQVAALAANEVQITPC